MEKAKTSKVVKIIAFAIVLTFRGLLSAEAPSPPYIQYVDEIVRAFVKEIKEEYDLHCCGSGGSMPNDVRSIAVMFSARRKISVEESRKIEVDCVQKLLKQINNHEKIRPYLREYPFGPDRVQVSLSFFTTEGKTPLDGSVTYVSLIKGRIFYDSAEMRKQTYTGWIDCTDPNNVVEYPPEEQLGEELIPICDEPFEEAVKIVNQAAAQENKK